MPIFSKKSKGAQGSKLTDRIASIMAERDSAKAQAKASAEKLAVVEKELAALKSGGGESAATIQALEKKLASTKAEVSALRAKLKNPGAAYEHANKGRKTPVAEGGEPEGKGDVYTQFHAIKDPAAKAEFYAKHKAAILATAAKPKPRK